MNVLGILGADPEVPQRLQRRSTSTSTSTPTPTPDEIEALVAQSQKRSAVFDAITNPTNVTVEVN